MIVFLEYDKLFEERRVGCLIIWNLLVKGLRLERNNERERSSRIYRRLICQDWTEVGTKKIDVD